MCIFGVPWAVRREPTDLSFGDDGQQPGHDGHQQGAEPKDEVQGHVGDERYVRAGEDSGHQIHPRESCVSKEQRGKLMYVFL